MKTKFIILTALALTACTVGHETDIDRAAAKRELDIEARHQASGCTFVKDHEAYRNCLLNTYNVNSPATYSTTTMEDGRAVAVVNQQSGGRGGSPCGLQPIPERAEYEWAAPTTVSQMKSVETVCQKKFEPQQTVVQTVEEVIPPPAPEVVFVQQEQVPPPQPVVEKRPVLVVREEPTCPCADPNDPCPQCYDK